jgi:hypothetical protein
MKLFVKLMTKDGYDVIVKLPEDRACDDFNYLFTDESHKLLRYTFINIEIHNKIDNDIIINLLFKSNLYNYIEEEDWYYSKQGININAKFAEKPWKGIEKAYDAFLKKMKAKNEGKK